METAKDLMTWDPVCCTRTTTLQEAAQLMVDNDCGEIPVVDHQHRPVGVITDRDICCRAVARGLDPVRTNVSDCMSSPAISVSMDLDLARVAGLMESELIRRLLVTDSFGRCCGIISQADIARKEGESLTYRVVREISQPPSVSGQSGVL